MIKVKVLEDIKSILQILFDDFGEVDCMYSKLITSKVVGLNYSEYLQAYIVAYEGHYSYDLVPDFYSHLSYKELKVKISAGFYNYLELLKEHR